MCITWTKSIQINKSFVIHHRNYYNLGVLLAKQRQDRKGIAASATGISFTFIIGFKIDQEG